LALGGLSGVLEYESSEFTFTALAATPIADVEKLVAEHGQYLPFDPPLAKSGATLGGTVAAGLSGPGRYRYGGVRDFLLGVRFVNGEGELVRGGGKVVKNVAGFELPKLMVGSLGRYGIMVELCFKVFPAPAATATVGVDFADVGAALEMMHRLAVSPLDLACLDLEPPARLWIRIGGLAESLPKRVERLRKTLGGDGTLVDIPDDEEIGLWEDVREFAWVPEDHGLVKIPLTPAQIPQSEQLLASCEPVVSRRYSVGGNVLWLAWSKELPPSRLEEILAELDRPALALSGRWPDPRLGKRADGVFADRLLRVLDPKGRFGHRSEPAVS
jgi:glycolate oxidase FAD binding subunit